MKIIVDGLEIETERPKKEWIDDELVDTTSKENSDDKTL